MSRYICALATLAALGLPLETKSWADPQDAPAERSEVTAAEVDALIEQLNDDQFAKREEASRKLSEIGEPAVPALKKAAAGPHLEVVTRSFAILENLLKRGGSPSATARKALSELAEGDNKSAASRADKILAKQDTQPLGQQFPFPPAGRGIRIFPGGGGILPPGGIGGARIQIQVQAFGGGKRSKVTMKEVNGVKTVDAEEDGKKVKIVDDPKAGIKMEVTQKKDGKDDTKKYAAKNADELKKNHPDAHKLYQKYINGGGLKIGILPAAPVPRIKDVEPADDEGESKAEDAPEDEAKKAGPEKPSDEQDPLEKAESEVDDAIRAIKKLREQLEEK